MRVFLSYASEERDLAQRITLALEGMAVDVFFDRDDLPPPGEFNLAIRTAIRRCDLFVFLASSQALAEGAYTLTELGIAQRRWPHPAERVLTLLVDATPIAALPPYLSAVTVLDPAGDPVAETVHAVARWRERRRRRWLARGTGAAAIVAVVAIVGVWLAEGVPEQDDVDVDNSHVYRLKNGARVRLVGSLVRNDSNVANAVVRKAVEWNAWRYNRCYDESFGQLPSPLPAGNVEIAFEIGDQLPRNLQIARSDFSHPEFSDCVRSTVSDQTLNAAGSKGAGKVVYGFRFEPGQPPGGANRRR